jgi:hypothetical protein
MAVRVQCSACGTTLTVAETAPKVLTCPRCLARIERPGAVISQYPPLRALPLDEESEGDSKLAVPIIVLLVFFVVVGLAVSAIPFPPGLKMIALLFLLLFAGITWAFATTGPKATHVRAETAVVPPPLETAESVATLDYSSLRRRVQPDSARTHTGWFVMGFFGALGVCAGGFAVLAATVDNRRNGLGGFYLLAVFAGVAAVIVSAGIINRNPRRRGILPGVILGTILGMVALGPCAFCYLMTLS